MRLIFPIARHARTLTRITVSLGLISSAHVPAISAQTVATRAAVRGPGAVLSFDTAQLRGLKYRMIGPARGGRVTTVSLTVAPPLHSQAAVVPANEVIPRARRRAGTRKRLETGRSLRTFDDQ